MDELVRWWRSPVSAVAHAFGDNVAFHRSLGTCRERWTVFWEPEAVGDERCGDCLDAIAQGARTISDLAPGELVELYGK